VITSMDNHFRFEDLWKDCPRGTYPNGTRLLESDDRFWLSKDASGNRILFAQENDRVSLRKVESVFSGLTIYQDLGITGSRFVIKLEADELADKFGLVCKDLVNRCGKFQGIQLFKAIFEVLKTWSNFLRPTRKGLSEEKFRGLWGELVILNDYYCELFDPDDAVSQWKGPIQESQDYTYGDSTLEVKTTFVATPTSIKISSLEQLDAPVNRQAIAHVRGSESLEGRSLDHLVSSIVAHLGINSDAYIEFQSKASSLIGEATDQQLARQVLLLGVSCYLVSDGFPRIRRSSVSPGVLKASYEIDLRALAEFRYESGLEAYLRGD